MLTITNAKLEQAGALAEIAKTAYAIYLDRMDKPPAPMLANFHSHIAKDTCFCALMKTKIIGYVVLICDADGGWWLDNIAILPEFQGKGIGQQLIAHSEQFLQEKTDKYRLYTNIVMTENIALYQQLGFVITDQGEQNGYQRIFFEKQLPSR